MSLNTDILIVEDNPADAELFIRSLKKNNIKSQLHIVSDGAEALDFVFCRRAYSSRNCDKLPRVIFLDLKLPKVSGLDVLEIIKSNNETKKIPVVIVSSSAEEADISKSYGTGANSYIVKPVDFNEFIETIQFMGKYWMMVNEDVW